MRGCSPRRARPACWRSSTAITIAPPNCRRRRSTASRTTITGPIKFAHDHRLVLGRRRLPRRAHHRLAARLPGAQLRSAVDQLRAAASAAHVGGDLRLRRQRAARHLLLCRAAHLPRAARRRPRAVVRGAGLQSLHRHRRHRLSARHHAGQGIRRARMVCRPVPDHRLGDVFPRLPRHGAPSARSRTSTWRTGSTSPSS